MGGGPEVGGEEPPAEELPGLGLQFVEVGALDDDGEDAGSFRNRRGDPHPVPGRVPQWSEDAVLENERERAGVEQGPQHLQDPVAGEVGTGELVRKLSATAM